MPNPKRRMSSSRRDKRRAHYKPEVPTYVQCPQCGAPRLPHRACPECGYYNGRKIIAKL
ncbi:50S ribosomal protein L32 [Bacteroidetes/Chlorobi group bacterium MS-B_bin-24]|nr:MAG: 50S ribosomal protein L32 [Bacteroidetes/Chlorobi group bacterium MS-B_bin-24]